MSRPLRPQSAPWRRVRGGDPGAVRRRPDGRAERGRRWEGAESTPRSRLLDETAVAMIPARG